MRRNRSPVDLGLRKAGGVGSVGVSWRSVVGVLVVVAAACTASPDDTTSENATETPTTSPVAATSQPTTTSPSQAADNGLPNVGGLSGRLVVLDATSNVITMDPDGANRIELTTDGGADRVYFQPVWSPDASQIAVSERRDDGSTYLTTLATDASEPQRSATTANPFYFYWSPSGDHIAYLHNASDGLELGIRRSDGSVTILDGGAPYYFAWGPDSGSLLVHVGSDRLEELRLDGTSSTVHPSPGFFQAPMWSDDGQTIAYVAADDQDQQLVVRRNGTSRTIVESAGPISIGMERSATLIAYRILGESDDTVSALPEATSAIQAALPAIAAQQTGGLYVYDVGSSESSLVTRDPAIAFWWSPVGRRLLYLTAEGSGTGARLRTHVWVDGDIADFSSFIPSPSFVRNYLPFFDQYALSTSLWSPDGDAFAYPGGVPGEGIGVWVQRLDTPAPDLVADGAVFVAWSPG